MAAPRLARAPEIRLFVKALDDRQLQRTIAEKTRITGRTLKEEALTTYKGMVRDGFDITPPSAGRGQTGSAAKRAGEGAISRDLQRIGMIPVDIKGHRMVTVAFGHPIAPVSVPTKINPRFENPQQVHDMRLRSKHGGRVSRGGRQPFFVDRRRMTSLKSRLFKEVGTLASWLVPAAQQLGARVPAWIARHSGAGRGTSLQIVESPNKVVLRVSGHFPATAEKEAGDTQRRLDFIKMLALKKLIRQMPHLLRKKLAGKL